MVTTTLVGPPIEEGLKVLGTLDKANVPVLAALWLQMPESEEWRLLLATPLVDSDGPLKTYKTVQSLLRLDASIKLALRDIQVVSPNDALIRLLRRSFKTGGAIADIRLTRSSVGNIFIDDAYIYRVH